MSEPREDIARIIDPHAFDLHIDEDFVREARDSAFAKADAILTKVPADYPDADATDAAHPAWWRGHDHTAAVFCQLVTKILDGEDNGGGFNYEPWGTLRKRLVALMDPNP